MEQQGEGKYEKHQHKKNAQVRSGFAHEFSTSTASQMSFAPVLVPTSFSRPIRLLTYNVYMRPPFVNKQMLEGKLFTYNSNSNSKNNKNPKQQQQSKSDNISINDCKYYHSRDYKDERLQLIIDNVLPNYDIFAFQELYAKFTSKKTCAIIYKHA